LPTFNRLGFLREAVDSVFAQTVTDWELIIADDGSEPDTLEYLADIAQSPRVRLLRLAHSGNPSAVRNAALRAARGRYVAFLDSDDVWLPYKLDIQLGAHQSFPLRHWSYSALLRIDADGEPMRDGLGVDWIPHQGTIFEQLLTFAAAIATPTVLVDRDFLEACGGFDEDQPFFEDYDLWLRLSLRSQVIVVDEPLVRVRNHEQHYSADRVRVYESRFRLLDKMSPHAATPHLQSVLRLERSKNAASLAFVCALSGRRLRALRMLWRSRACALRLPQWWTTARVTLAHVLAPRWVRDWIRRSRRRRSQAETLAPRATFGAASQDTPAHAVDRAAHARGRALR
jgi:glycosyltransferase involved in cell wall biosynthesis